MKNILILQKPLQMGFEALEKQLLLYSVAHTKFYTQTNLQTYSQKFKYLYDFNMFEIWQLWSTSENEIISISSGKFINMVLLKICQSVPCLRLSHSLETFITLEKIFHNFQSKLKLQDKIHFGPLKEGFHNCFETSRWIQSATNGQFLALIVSNTF